MLKVENVSKYYDDFKAVDNLSFEVKEGEIFGLLGANGAGKTTTFRMIMNLLEPTSGKITLNGKKIDYNVTDEIGFLTEERSLLLKLTVKELMIYYGTLKSMKKDEIISELKKWLKRFKIEEYENKMIKELSKGNKQKIQFISSIIHKPKLLILDEPFSGLDPINVDMFIDVINELKENGTIIIFSSHQMNNVELFCEKLLILNHGKTIIQGNLKDIKNNYDERKILIKADVSNFEECKKMIDKSIEKFKTIDVLINNAGITKDNLLLRMSVEDFEQVIDINLKGTFNVTKNVVPYMMKKRKGKIVNLASVVGISGNAGQCNYAASKSGIIGFTKSIAKELASRNILANCVAPGFIDTDMTSILNDNVKENINSQIPLKRMGKSEEIANSVYFLAGEENTYITGQVLNVDGGMLM